MVETGHVTPCSPLIGPVSQDCIVSPWSAWSSCPAPACHAHGHGHHGGRGRLPLRQRNRTILARAGPGGQSCPAPAQLLEMGACPDPGPGRGCEWYSWGAGQWAECQLAPGYSCGKGLQTRKVHCEDAAGQLVPDWRCSKLAAVSTRRSCEVACPRSCEVSGWTDWSRCPDLCQAGAGEAGQLLMEIQRRERVVLVPASLGGQPCPATTQVRPCPLLAGSCKAASWQLGAWSSCQLPASMSCGQGLRVRSVGCSRAGLQSLALAACLGAGGRVPEQSEVCTVDCSQHTCQLGSWGAWSTCPHQQCSSSSTRTRVREAVSAGGCEGTHLARRQEEACSCGQYTSAEAGPWSACSLATAHTGHHCGPGLRYRRLECRDAAGRLVEAALCGGETHVTEQCRVECAADCQLSAWSAWGLCDAVCGPGLRNRTSRVVQLPRAGGRPCPGPTVEYDSCSYSCDSFSWRPEPWSQCSLGHGECGLGTRRRTVRWPIQI